MSRPRFSVLTASYRHERSHLPAAYDNLCQQTVPWERAIQIDGDPSEVPPIEQWLALIALVRRGDRAWRFFFARIVVRAAVSRGLDIPPRGI